MPDALQQPGTLLKRIAFPLIALLPAGGVWQWWGFVKSYPLLAGLLILLYEGVVVFVKKVWQDGGL